MFINFNYELKLSGHPTLGCGLDLMTCFQRTEYGKGKIVTFLTENLADTTLTKLIKVNISNVMLITYPRNDVIRTLHL